MALLHRCPGTQRGQVRTRLGLGEALAPDLPGVQDRRDVPLALLLGTEAQQRRAKHVEPDDVDELRRAGTGQFLVDHDLLDRRSAAATELPGPSPADVPGPVTTSLPAAQSLDPGVE